MVNEINVQGRQLRGKFFSRMLCAFRLVIRSHCRKPQTPNFPVDIKVCLQGRPQRLEYIELEVRSQYWRKLQTCPSIVKCVSIQCRKGAGGIRTKKKRQWEARRQNLKMREDLDDGKVFVQVALEPSYLGFRRDPDSKKVGPARYKTQSVFNSIVSDRRTIHVSNPKDPLCL